MGTPAKPFAFDAVTDVSGYPRTDAVVSIANSIAEPVFNSERLRPNGGRSAMMPGPRVASAKVSYLPMRVRTPGRRRLRIVAVALFQVSCGCLATATIAHAAAKPTAQE